jgi:hypothetical protein
MTCTKKFRGRLPYLRPWNQRDTAFVSALIAARGNASRAAPEGEHPEVGEGVETTVESRSALRSEGMPSGASLY